MIELSGEYKVAFNKLEARCAEIENLLEEPIITSESTDIQNKIESLRPLLAESPEMISTAAYLYDKAKGECVDLLWKKTSILHSKSNIQKMWIDSQLSKYNSLFIRVESVTKKLDKSIDTLVSLLSFNKELIKNQI